MLAGTWVVSNESGNSPLVCPPVPGLTGGSGDTYVQYMIQRLWAFGILSVVFNSRGTSDSPVTSPQVRRCRLREP